jgi:hypothetical protein
VSRRAARTDGNQSAIVDALRQYGCVVQSLAAVGSGVPDLLVGHRATRRLLLIEVKDPTQQPNKRRLKPLQVEWHREWSGLPVYIVERVEQVPALLAGDSARVTT